MPILFFFIFAMFVLGLVKMFDSIKPTAKVLSYRESMCNEMFISQAIHLAQNSNCMENGTLNVYEYECNEDLGRISFPMDLEVEQQKGSRAMCHVFTSSGNTNFQWVNDSEVE